MSKLRHFALYTSNPERTAAFYKKAFDMTEVGRTNSAFADGIFLSDGVLNLAVLHYKRPEDAATYGSSNKFGMSHFGFWVDDLEDTRRRLRELGAEYIDTRDPEAAPMGFFEEKWKGPDGTVIDPSTRAPALAGGAGSGFRPTGVLEGATGLPVRLHITDRGWVGALPLHGK